MSDKEENQQEEEVEEVEEVEGSTEMENIQKPLEGDDAIRKFLGGDTFVNDLLGVKLNPVTLASLAMMQEAGCELISGKDVTEMSNVMLEILIFVYIHTEDADTIADLISNSTDHKKALKMKALSMGHEITPKQIPALVEQIVNILSEATGTKVEPVPDDELEEKKTKTGE